MGACLVKRDHFFAVRALYIFFTIFVLICAQTCSIAVQSSRLRRNKLLFTSQNLGIAFAFNIKHLYTIHRRISNAPSGLLLLIFGYKTHENNQLETYV